MPFAHCFGVHRHLLLVGCLCCLPTPVSGQSLTPPVITFAAAAAADWTTTYHALSSDNGREADPVFRPAHNQPMPTILMGSIIDTIGVLVVVKTAQTHPHLRKAAVIGLYAASAVRVGFAIHNIQQHRQVGYSW